MIYLIGGAPRCGKTTTAKRLSKKLNVSWLSTDTLERVVRSCMSAKEITKKFPKTVIRRKTKYSNDLMYSQYTTKQITSTYLKQSRAIWTAVETFVDCELYEGRSIVIEGYHIHPELVKKLSKKYGPRNVRAVFFTKMDAEDIVSKGKKFADKNDWFVNRTKNETTYLKIAHMIVELSKFFNREAKKYNLKLYNTDTHFKNKLAEAQRYLVK
ncbi:hypothetical protein HOB10_04755 [Candidatus Parcubacteria bacterium]|jgi:2-phosphoglycerate kinase|nr:hypothetical protein [Candidatus Parcubacteria bacterium]